MSIRPRTDLSTALLRSILEAYNDRLVRELGSRYAHWALVVDAGGGRPQYRGFDDFPKAHSVCAGKTKMKHPSDPTLSYLPTDKVYEHGFDPLQGGFVDPAQTPFEIFDQWIEVLPTDQAVPVEVTYHPKTGQQI